MWLLDVFLFFLKLHLSKWIVFTRDCVHIFYTIVSFIAVMHSHLIIAPTFFGALAMIIFWHLFWQWCQYCPAIIHGIYANPVLADASNGSSTETELEGANITGLRKIEDGSVISNIHTSKWRIFTDNGREYFLQASIFFLFTCCFFFFFLLLSLSPITICKYTQDLFDRENWTKLKSSFFLP